MKNGWEKGFILLEIIIVIIIIGVLTSLALPQLINMVERSYAAEALTQMASIQSGLERCYLINNNDYSKCIAYGCGESSNWGVFGLEPPCGDSHHFFYGIVTYVGEPGSIGITAWRKNVHCAWGPCDPMSPVITMKVYPKVKITGFGTFKDI